MSNKNIGQPRELQAIFAISCRDHTDKVPTTCRCKDGITIDRFIFRNEWHVSAAVLLTGAIACYAKILTLLLGGPGC